jgi:hypothetical protein
MNALVLREAEQRQIIDGWELKGGSSCYVVMAFSFWR